jgi:hypothetical protein
MRGTVATCQSLQGAHTHISRITCTRAQSGLVRNGSLLLMSSIASEMKTRRRTEEANGDKCDPCKLHCNVTFDTVRMEISRSNHT